MNIYIIGGGASGVACAIEASKNPNNEITIIEKNDKLMKKLSITGNGSCNFTNDSFFSFEHETNLIYNNTFFRKIYKNFNQNKLLAYIKDLGIDYIYKEHYGSKYYYPFDKSARNLCFNLYDILISRKVNIIYNEEVIDIKIINNQYIITTNKNEYKAEKLVVSTGGASYPKTGSDGKMFNILKDIGINIIEPIPSLTPLIFNDKKLSSLKGIRLEAEIRVEVDNKECFRDYGEIQFNENSVSGIPILNASSKIARLIKNKNSIKLIIDMLPDIEDISYLTARQNQIKYKKAKDFMCGIVDSKIFNYIIDKNNIKFNNDRLVSDIYIKELSAIFNSLKNFEINIIDLAGFDIAQTTKGGVDIKSINDLTYESQQYKNLYFTGEVIDVDGICGGYNLSFAFISGINVGKML